MIFGLYLDGARWDPEGGHLSDSLPGQRFSKLPEIHFKPVQVISALTFEIHEKRGRIVLLEEG